MMEHIETVIVGGGQSGFATSYYLKQRGREHVVLEQTMHPASAWRNERWDSFTMVTPNWTVTLPGAEYNGPDKDGFLSRDEIVAYFEAYVERFQLPIQYNTRVESIEPMEPSGYCVETNQGTFRADNVVIATGHAQREKIPPVATNLSADITQLHSRTYRNPESLPAGAVLIVGSGQSGAQIAEELHQSGRQVYLATGSTGRAPRRYRGKDVVEWLLLIGFFTMPPEKLPFPKAKFSAPHVSGGNGGHTLNLHQFARDGITLLGHVRDVNGDKVLFAPDLHENLAKADQLERNMLKMIDGYIQARGLDIPEEELPELRDGYEHAVIEELDLRASGINTVIWATGYTIDLGLVKLPVSDEDGYPIQTRGVGDYPGLYFIGFPWMPSLKSALLLGVDEIAQHIVTNITERQVYADPALSA